MNSTEKETWTWVLFPFCYLVLQFSYIVYLVALIHIQVSVTDLRQTELSLVLGRLRQEQHTSKLGLTSSWVSVVFGVCNGALEFWTGSGSWLSFGSLLGSSQGPIILTDCGYAFNPNPDPSPSPLALTPKAHRVYGKLSCVQLHKVCPLADRPFSSLHIGWT